MPDGLTSLQHLDLADNQLSSLTLSPDTASSIDFLGLQISENPLVNIRLPAGFDKIRFRFLSNYELVYYDPGDAPVAPVDSLEIQVVRQNGVSETIEVDRDIVNLHLNNQRLISIFLPEGLMNLQVLDLSGNQFTSFTLP